MTDFQAMLLFIFSIGALAIGGVVTLHYIQAKSISTLTDLAKDLHKNE
jgi:hypothetical protein